MMDLSNQITEIYNFGTPNYSIIHSEETTILDEWKLEFIPYDGEVFGTSTTSEILQINCDPNETCE